MTDKITSIAELKKRMHEYLSYYQDGLGKEQLCLRVDEIDELIEEFEASVKKQIDVLETIPAESVRHVRAKELRRILGGEG